MMVEPKKLENIAATIQQQAALLRRAGRTSQAKGMERRAHELRALSMAGNSNTPGTICLHAA
jgi:propanediol dehydratase small subunit